MRYMKKHFLFLLCMLSVSCVFAQKGRVIEAGAKALRGTTSLTEQVSRQVAQQQVRLVGWQARLAEELAYHSLVPLKMSGIDTSVPTVFALPRADSPAPKTFVAQLAPKGYDDDKYPAENRALDEYIMRLSAAESAEFMYRGMHLTSLDEVKHILLNGLEMGRTDYKGIYLSSAPLVAKLYAETSVPKEMIAEVPVFVLIKKTHVADYLKQDRSFLSYYYCGTDIPAEAISHMFAFLDINGRSAWYRVVLQNEMIFMPLKNGPELNIR